MLEPGFRVPPILSWCLLRGKSRSEKAIGKFLEVSPTGRSGGAGSPEELHVPTAGHHRCDPQSQAARTHPGVTDASNAATGPRN